MLHAEGPGNQQIRDSAMLHLSQLHVTESKSTCFLLTGAELQVARLSRMSNALAWVSTVPDDSNLQAFKSSRVSSWTVPSLGACLPMLSPRGPGYTQKGRVLCTSRCLRTASMGRHEGQGVPL